LLLERFELVFCHHTLCPHFLFAAHLYIVPSLAVDFLSLDTLAWCWSPQLLEDFHSCHALFLLLLGVLVVALFLLLLLLFALLLLCLGVLVVALFFLVLLLLLFALLLLSLLLALLLLLLEVPFRVFSVAAARCGTGGPSGRPARARCRCCWCWWRL
jgi:hypothetical protein